MFFVVFVTFSNCRSCSHSLALLSIPLVGSSRDEWFGVFSFLLLRWAAEIDFYDEWLRRIVRTSFLLNLYYLYHRQLGYVN